ncbi:PX-associated-domain-containing protein [Xylaria digitata]|nr:PX-associated-domain-containing protein [Xylaria digitata]
MASGDYLTAPQLRALLDILIHHETYAEVQSFRSPEAIETYGWPFVDRDSKGRPARPHSLSLSPLLQLLLTRLVLTAPAVRDLSTGFWPVTFKGIMKQFGDADLSDSYDKGTLGTRKRLATAASTIHEAVTRGLLSGVPCGSPPDLHARYDREKAQGLTKAWRDCIHHLVYENLIDEIFDQLSRTADLEAHSPALKGAIEYAQLHIATFLHQVFVLSAEGPYLLKIIENVHRLVPYTVIGQTLRVGNAASMINGMSRLFLSKLSMAAVSNWIGLTSNAADGMNLNFRKVVEKIKLNKEIISNEHITAIDAHLAGDRKRREAVSLTDRQHTSCLEYYAGKLAIRDRERIIDILCNSTPDLTTAIVSDGIGALDPMIRVVHKNVDLRKHLAAMEGFLTDFIKTTKPKPQEGNLRFNLLTVEDFVGLLQRNRHRLWAYLHDFCDGCPDLRDTWREWMKDAIKLFRQQSRVDPHERINIGDKLQEVFSKLTTAQRESILEKIDAHSEYLTMLGELSRAKMQRILDDVHGRSRAGAVDTSGPGIFASRWQALLDETSITPSRPNGPLRSGKDVKGIRAARKSDNKGNFDISDTNTAILARDESTSPVPPDVCMVIGALGLDFKRVVANISRDGLPKVNHKGH